MTKLAAVIFGALPWLALFMGVYNAAVGRVSGPCMPHERFSGASIAEQGSGDPGPSQRLSGHSEGVTG